MRLKRVSDYLVRIFTAPPGERSERDIQALLPIVMMKTTCLKDLDRECVTYILQQAQLEKYNLGDLIIKQGDTGETFYIVLEGSVSIYLDTKKDEKVISQEPHSFPLPPPPRRMSSQISLPERESDDEYSSDPQSDHHGSATGKRQSAHGSRSRRPEHTHRRSTLSRDKKDKKNSRKKYGICVNALGRYQSFGELALIYPNGTRNASVISEDKTTQLLAISYTIFENTLQDVLERHLEEKRLFIQSHPFFSKWSAAMQRQLQWSLVRGTYRIGDQVIKQGDPVIGLTFLLSGRARLVGEPLRHRIQFPELFNTNKINPYAKLEAPSPSPVQRDDTTLEEIVDNLRTTKRRRNMLAGMDPLTYIRRTDGYAAAEKVVFDKILDICTIEEGEVITDFELLLGLDKNIFSVVCNTACTFFHLDDTVFDRLVSKKSPQTMGMLKYLAMTKLSRRVMSLQGQRMAILSPLHLKIQDLRFGDPNMDERGDNSDKQAPPQIKPVTTPHPLASPHAPRSASLLDWFVRGKTPLLRPISKDAIYYRDLIQKRARFREIARERGPKELQEVKSLARRIKDSYWYNLRERRRAVNTMKRLKLEHSDMTPASRWK